MAATLGSRVRIYSPNTKLFKNIEAFQTPAFGGDFRNEHHLFAVGGEQGIVKVFHVDKKSCLRQMKHKKPVYCVKFSSNRTNIVTGCDDQIVRLWDISEGKQVLQFKEHTDYVRNIQTFSNLIYSGSFDKTIQAFDMRDRNPIFKLEHQYPVSSMCLSQDANVLTVAGGNLIILYDLLTQQRLAQIQVHQKQITNVFYNQDYTRLISTGLDNRLKVYDYQKQFKVLYSLKYPEGIVSAAMDENRLAVGLADCYFSVRSKQKLDPNEITEEFKDSEQFQFKHIEEGLLQTNLLPQKDWRYFRRGMNSKPTDQELATLSQEIRQQPKLKEYDNYLKQFKYKECLDHALQSQEMSVIYSICEELLQRSALKAALVRRTPQELEALLSFIIQRFTECNINDILMILCKEVIDLYGCVFNRDEKIDKLFSQLSERAQTEVETQKKCLEVQGMLQIFNSQGQINQLTQQTQLQSFLVNTSAQFQQRALNLFADINLERTSFIQMSKQKIIYPSNLNNGIYQTMSNVNAYKLKLSQFKISVVLLDIFALPKHKQPLKLNKQNFLNEIDANYKHALIKIKKLLLFIQIWKLKQGYKIQNIGNQLLCIVKKNQNAQLILILNLDVKTILRLQRNQNMKLYYNGIQK